jgi:hypothetical protein
VAPLATPNTRLFTMPADDDSLNTYALDSTNDSFPVRPPDGDGWTIIGHVPKISHGPISSALVMGTPLPAPLPPGASATCTEKRRPIPISPRTTGADGHKTDTNVNARAGNRI